MGYCFIISTNKDFCGEVKSFLEEKTNTHPVEIHLRSKKYDDDKISLFETIHAEIDQYSAESLRNSRVVIDEVVQWKELNPLQTTSTHGESLFAMLVLAFPELRFTFLNHTGPFEDSPPSEYNFNHWLDNVNGSQSPTPLFDSDGFRNQIRQLVNDQKEKKENHNLKIRKCAALSIEDEEAFALFHGYTAYKMGYRCGVATSESNLKQLNNYEADLQYEDIFLNFPDRKGDNLSNIKTRDEEGTYSVLKNAQNRIFISVGHSHTNNSDANKGYLKWLKLTGKKIKSLYKPNRGVYDVIDDSGLLKKYWKRRGEKFKTNKEKKTLDGSKAAHSTPGILLLLADKLLIRSNKMLESVQSVSDAVHSALLATEAKELLGGRTPTTSLQALALQHKAEVTAESMFFGVEYSLRVKERFKDIRKEVEAITHWFSRKAGKRQGINARLHIVEILAKRFSEFNQFEEEMACLAEARKLQFRLWRNQKFIRRWVYPFQKYVEHSLYSIPRFLSIVFLWIVVFSWVYYFLGMENMRAENFNYHYLDSFAATSRYFFTFELTEWWANIFRSTKMNIWGDIILAIQGAISFFSLSMLISHMYLLVSRR